MPAATEASTVSTVKGVPLGISRSSPISYPRAKGIMPWRREHRLPAAKSRQHACPWPGCAFWVSLRGECTAAAFGRLSQHRDVGTFTKVANGVRFLSCNAQSSLPKRELLHVVRAT